MTTDLPLRDGDGKIKEPEINICWHGTDAKTAEIILRDGFKPYTHFAAHVEDALAFGGPFIFDVFFDAPAANWQFLNKEQIPPDRIRTLTQFWSKTLHGAPNFTRTEIEGDEPKSR